MAAEMTKSRSEMKSIEIEGLSYHIRSFGLIRVVLVTNVPKSPEDIISMLGFRFINEYGEILMDWDSNLSIFTPFGDTIREIIIAETSTDESSSIKPTKKLNTGEIFSLPHRLHSTALAMVSLGEGTIKIIAKESGEKATIARKNLVSLQKMGFVGIKKNESVTKYFCVI